MALLSGLLGVKTLVLLHGSQDWEGPGRIRQAKRTSTVHGPGLYLTTSAATARKYAKGGGSVIRVELELPIRWLMFAKIPTTDAERFVRTLPRLGKRKEILADIQRIGERDGDRGQLWPGVVLNLMINYGVLTSTHGPAIAEFMVASGVDADLIQQSGEDWVLLFNPLKVIAHRKVPAGEAVDSPRIRIS